MKKMKILLYLIFLLQVSFANEKLETLASTIATPFYNVYNENILEVLEQYIIKHKEIEAIKIYDTLINKTAITYYKKDGKFINEIDKEFPSSLILPNRFESSKIVKDEKLIGVITLYYNTQLGENFLSKVESDYLDKKKVITMCVDPNWLPFEKIENGKYIGFIADIIKLIAEKINMPLKLIPTKSWQESLELAKNRECDILSSATKTIKRDKYLNFTSSYFDAPIVVATNIKVPFINDIEQIIDKKLAIVRGYSTYDLLLSKYPNINLVEVNSLEDGLEKVEAGEVFGYLDNSVVLNYKIQRTYSGILTISGKFDENYYARIATRNDEPLLGLIFEKAINSISQSEKSELYKKWIAIKIERIEVIDYKIIAFSVLILLIFIYWNRKIAKANKELAIAQKEIKKLAMTDKLTGLFNRMKLDEVIEREIQRSKRFSHDLSFCILDIDHFKSVNDEYGHQVGDIVLIEIAQILKKYTRKTDYVGRWGGEEFVIICPETSKEGILKLLEFLRVKIASYTFTEVTNKTASFGVTLFQKDNDTIESLIKKADIALYKAKNQGRNKVVFEA